MRVEIEVIPNSSSKRKAMATVTFENVEGGSSMELRGFSVVDGAKGLFVGWPQMQVKNVATGKYEYEKQSSTSDTELFKKVSVAVLNAYKAALSGGSSSTQKVASSSSSSDDDIFNN